MTKAALSRPNHLRMRLRTGEAGRPPSGSRPAGYSPSRRSKRRGALGAPRPRSSLGGGAVASAASLLFEGWSADDEAAAAGVVAVAAVCTAFTPCLPCLRRCLWDISYLHVLGGVRCGDRLRAQMSRSRYGVLALEHNLNAGREAAGTTASTERHIALASVGCVTELLRLSVLDQSPVAEGSTGSQALRNTIDLARLTDRLGYHRYWVAEHHGGPSLAGPSPEVLIGPIASATERMRVGSGGVMLPHYSPLKAAQSFSVLAGLYPGRIDLGIGR